MGKGQDFNPLPNNPGFPDLGEKFFENILGKGQNIGNQYFLLFPKCCLLYKYFYSTSINCTFILLSANAFKLDSPLFCRLVKGLQLSH